MSEPVVRRHDRSFGPTVLLGLAGAALAAVAGTREWATSSGDAAGIKVDAAVTGSDSAPLVTALALVALAAWGVVLVVRGQVRRFTAVLGLTASVAASVAVLLGFTDAQDDALQAVMDKGATGDAFRSSLTAWYYLSGAGTVMSALSFAVAALRAPGWPAMGEKYDAPGSRADKPVTDEDMWRALDEGHDPTS
jgi:uncharacterized membrane protein (TIGR02234 family)